MAEGEGGGGSGNKTLDTFVKGKVAGIPVWGLGIGIAALFIAFMYLRNRNKPTTTNTPSAPADLSATDQNAGINDAGYGLPSGPIGGYLSNDPTNPAYPVGLGNTGLPGPVTNVQWSRLAFDQLVAQGDDPSLVEAALTKYISGMSLSVAEQAVIDQAHRLFGAPPEGLIPVTGGNNPDPNPNPNPDPGTGSNPITLVKVALQSVSDTILNGHPTRVITWQPVAGATGYQVQFSGDPKVYYTTNGEAKANWTVPPPKGSGRITITPVNGATPGPSETFTV